MLSSPYPVPHLAGHQAAHIIAWAAGVAAGVWVLVSPPVSYEGIGLVLTTTWGILLALGSGLSCLGHLTRRYQIELPGLVLALGGVVIYGYLSWQATFTDSLGSGPRACLLVVLAMFIVARVRVLLFIDEQARRLIELREETA